jgi:hypothetical protein
VYEVYCYFENRFGAEFGWTFQIETDDYMIAFDDAIRTFWSGLTISERKDAAQTLRAYARPILVDVEQTIIENT